MRPHAFSRAALPPAPPPLPIYEVEFQPSVPMAEVRDTLELARLAAASVHGDASVELDVRWSLDQGRRRLLIDAATQAGRTFALIFFGYARREFGGDAARVRRVPAAPDGQIAGAA